MKKVIRLLFQNPSFKDIDFTKDVLKHIFFFGLNY